MAAQAGLDTKAKLDATQKIGKGTKAVVGAVSVLFIVLPVLFNNNVYIITQMITLVSYAVAALGLTVALGFAGQIALCQAAFFGLGAYSLAILSGMHGWGYWWAFPVGIIVPTLAGMILGAICLRLVTHYLALATIGFGIIIYLILFNWTQVTGGADGIMNIPRPSLPFLPDMMLTGALGFSGDVWFYWFALVCLMVACWVVYHLRHSRLGRALLAVREDELAAQTNGVDLFKAKMLAFSLSAALGGLGGMIFASGYMYVNPTLFIFDQSVIFFAMAIVGGSSSIIGTLIGALFLGVMPEVLRGFNAYYKMIYGGMIIITLYYLPGGIWGLVTGIYKKWKGRNEPVEKWAAGIRFPSGGTLSFLEERRKEKEASDQKEIILETRGLKKHFGGVKAVDGVDFQVRKGEIHVLIGPNGSGKTTVINVLSGLYQATDGSVFYKGREITNHKPHQIAAYGISRTFQNIRLFSELSVLENVMIGQHHRTKANLLDIVLGLKKSRAEEEKIRFKAEEALRFVGFETYHELAKNLSYGQRRMVEIARALVQEPELLFLDEPAAGMNTEETQELVKLLKRLNELGLTILLIEHDMDLVTKVADTVTVLDFGKQISEGTVDEVLRDPEVIKAYLGEEFAHAEGQ